MCETSIVRVAMVKFYVMLLHVKNIRSRLSVLYQNSSKLIQQFNRESITKLG